MIFVWITIGIRKIVRTVVLVVVVGLDIDGALIAVWLASKMESDEKAAQAFSSLQYLRSCSAQAAPRYAVSGCVLTDGYIYIYRERERERKRK